jgi:NTP pyrophosphatase (non-canonical NTP hydrolase)
MDLNDYLKEVLETNKVANIAANKDLTWQKLALIHTEISEATSAYRKGNYGYDKDTFESELMDALWRILELLGIWECDVEEIFQITKERIKGRKGEFK